MSSFVVAAMIAVNLGLIFLLVAAPLGTRTIRLSRSIKADRARVWEAIWPLGRDAGWSGEVVAARSEPETPGRARLTLSWEGRDGAPIERLVEFSEVEPGERVSMRVIDDTSLDPAFWAGYRETAALAADGDRVRVTLTRTDRYRGAAFFAFRYFALRRELAKLGRWTETGKYRAGGIFEHPATQVLFAVVSAVILWPFFGLTLGGFAVAAVLTTVVALHELGHMAAFRLMGHRRARMIFVPLLGGIAIGGRPYDSRFEVAFVALMGAGFSAFIVPVAIAMSVHAAGEGWRAAAGVLATLAGCAALFNIANLVPVWKFDGGQVLRQICPNGVTLALASFALLSGFLALAYRAGFPPALLVGAGAVFAILSLITAGTGVKPRHELKPISRPERLGIAAALVSVFAIHGSGVLWASARMDEFRAFERMRIEQQMSQPEFSAHARHVAAGGSAG